MDYWCIDEAADAARRFQITRTIGVQTMVGNGLCDVAQETEPPGGPEEQAREEEKERMEAANRVLEARGLRRLTLAELDSDSE